MWVWGGGIAQGRCRCAKIRGVDGASFIFFTHLPTALHPTEYGNSTITPQPSSNGALVSRGYIWKECSRDVIQEFTCSRWR